LSCNSCHNLAAGGSDNIETSIGHGWQKGPRNSPTVLNSVFNVAQFWDGRAEDLRTQAKGPIQAAVEMAATPEHVINVLKSIPEYQNRFTTAFPGESNPVTFNNVAKAIEGFEATLITPAARFDQFLEGNATILTNQEKTRAQAVYGNRLLGLPQWHQLGWAGLLPIRRGGAPRQ
jgi:cytochrome c peroxidase